MSVCVCVSMCLCVCLCVCLYSCKYACMSVCMYVCVSVCRCVCLCACSYACKYVGPYVCLYAYAYARSCDVRVYVLTVYVRVSNDVRMYVSAYILYQYLTAKYYTHSNPPHQTQTKSPHPSSCPFESGLWKTPKQQKKSSQNTQEKNQSSRSHLR